MAGFQVKSTPFFPGVLSYFFQGRMKDEKTNAIGISSSLTIGGMA